MIEVAGLLDVTPGRVWEIAAGSVKSLITMDPGAVAAKLEGLVEAFGCSPSVARAAAVAK